VPSWGAATKTSIDHRFSSYRRQGAVSRGIRRSAPTAAFVKGIAGPHTVPRREDEAQVGQALSGGTPLPLPQIIGRVPWKYRRELPIGNKLLHAEGST
jgi:hypothetical protein